MKKSIISILIIFLVLFQSCKEKNLPEPVAPDEINMTLIYAVNHNNLNECMTLNKRQMEKAALQSNTTTDKILIYSYINGAPVLQEMVCSNGSISYIDIKKYSNDILSADADRMKEVLNEAVARYPQSQKTLFLWGHGMGPVNPYKYNKLPSQMDNTKGGTPDIITPETPEVHAYGGEYTSSTNTTMVYIDLDEMADAIPNSTFETIWFDCCYMGSIEVAYQLRNKCNYLVAYPTEIWENGLPYDLVLPYVVDRNQDLVKGAEALYHYYADSNSAVTVAVMDMNHIWDFAAAVKNYVQALDKKPSFDGVIDYSRLNLARPNSTVHHPYYDLISWLSKAEIAQTVNKDNYNDVINAYNKFVVKAYCGDRDFKGQQIDGSKFFGISVYDFNNENSERDIFYKKLDWWMDVVQYSKWNIDKSK